MSIRHDVANLLRENWAEIPELADVRVIASEAELDQIAVPTALLRWKSTEREPSAPLSTRRVGLLLTIVSPHEDLDRAGDDLEDLSEAVLNYLGPRFQHDTAEVVGYSGRLALDIPLTVLATSN